jgi:hypothetical protein
MATHLAVATVELGSLSPPPDCAQPLAASKIESVAALSDLALEEVAQRHRDPAGSSSSALV